MHSVKDATYAIICRLKVLGVVFGVQISFDKNIANSSEYLADCNLDNFEW